MDKSKEQLLQELKQMGQHPSGRKVRADTGQSHNIQQKGKLRGHYKAGWRKKRDIYFREFNTSYPDGELPPMYEDDIFSLTLKTYKRARTDRPSTYNRREDKLSKTLENRRWDWWYAQACEEPDQVLTPMSATAKERFLWHYYIQEEDMDIWTYKEWAEAYFYYINYRSEIAEPTRESGYKLNYFEYLQAKKDGRIDTVIGGKL